MTEIVGRPRLAVLGSPITHSLSPRLHRAAYGLLGLDWSYDAVEVASGALSAHLASLGSEWRGLSLTMPLKREVIPLLAEADDLVRLTGVANTVLLSASGHSGFNTDVYGITAALRDHGVSDIRTLLVLGAGATASSALVAGQLLGAEAAQFRVRDPARASGVRALAAELGIAVDIRALDDPTLPADDPDVVISTLPNGAVIDPGSSVGFLNRRSLHRHSVLLDVAYDPWPTPLATAWLNADGRVISGVEMLVNQALMQVRIFVSGQSAHALPNEAAIVQAMHHSIAL